MISNKSWCQFVYYFMGCVVSCFNQAMSLFGRSTPTDNESKAILERKLYLAKESPEPVFDLSDCHLQEVPPGIYSICKVYRKEYLYLHDNKLRSLENGGLLSDLYLLKILNISSNKISHLSDNIKHLVNLTELYIQDNLIKTLPESIQHLQNLQVFDVSKNKLCSLTSSLGKLTRLKTLKLKENEDLKELCPELCLATNLNHIDLDGQQFIFPPSEVATKDTAEIMKFLCENLGIEYSPPFVSDIETPVPEEVIFVQDPFTIRNRLTWEQQEAAIIEQENKVHQAAKLQRERFLTNVLEEQLHLDKEIAKVQIAREEERQNLIRAIQQDEKDIECLVKNFIKSEYLKPEIVQQQLAHEQAEHDRLIEITRQNYDNIKKNDVLKAMELLIEEDCTVQYYKKHYHDNLNDVKQSILLQELYGTEKLSELLNAKDQSRTAMVSTLLEDQNVQKAVVASLVEKLDARSWSLNQEISLITTNLSRLSIIEQDKRKLQVAYNFNELLHQRVQLVNLLDDLLNQQNKRRNQLIETMKEMETEKDNTADYWLKNYQKVIDSAPKNLLCMSKKLDPVFANFLLQEGVIHCLPFLVKFFFSDESLLNINNQQLKDSGVSLSSDRENILRAIHLYVKSKITDNQVNQLEPSAPNEDIDEVDMLTKCTGVVSVEEKVDAILESECVICMDAKCEAVFVPCGHMCCCQTCADTQTDSCPMCRCSIERTIKVMVP